MNNRITNISTAEFDESTSIPGERILDISGSHLGVRIEEIPPDGTTSHHHYHTAEEEHVVVLEGDATLHLGSEQIQIGVGDHVWFPAGEPIAHHIENSSDRPFKLLVFGERKTDDVVFYPNGSVMLVKSVQGRTTYSYSERESDS